MAKRPRQNDRKLAMIRRATTMSSTRKTTSGKPKEKGGAKPVTLPKISFRVLPD